MNTVCEILASVWEMVSFAAAATSLLVVAVIMA